jgi:hypothetical protein
MKKFLLIGLMLTTLLFPLVNLATVTAAVNIVPACNGGALSGQGASVCSDVNSVNSSSSDPLITVIKTVMNIISYITGIAAVVLIIISALRFITSGGDSNNVAAARKTLTYALIGIAVIILSQIIIAFVLDNVS